MFTSKSDISTNFFFSLSIYTDSIQAVPLALTRSLVPCKVTHRKKKKYSHIGPIKSVNLL